MSPACGARADLGAQVQGELVPKTAYFAAIVLPFLFNRDQVLTTTGRAGIFRFDNRGERWQRSMEGFIASNGVSPYVDHVCQSRSQPRIVYALAGLGGDVSLFNGLF